MSADNIQFTTRLTFTSQTSTSLYPEPDPEPASEPEVRHKKFGGTWNFGPPPQWGQPTSITKAKIETLLLMVQGFLVENFKSSVHRNGCEFRVQLNRHSECIVLHSSGFQSARASQCAEFFLPGRRIAFCWLHGDSINLCVGTKSSYSTFLAVHCWICCSSSLTVCG